MKKGILTLMTVTAVACAVFVSLYNWDYPEASSTLATLAQAL